MKNLVSLVLILCSLLSVKAQQRDIVKIIDHLTARWDKGSVTLETYDGFKKFCHTKDFRNNTIDLLNKIHHYDTVLYNTVTAKYETNKDPEAAATLRDIDIVEKDYTTRSFLDFLHKECKDINDVDRNATSENADDILKDKKRIEAELIKYVSIITQRIDNIDEHIHHLKKLSERE